MMLPPTHNHLPLPQLHAALEPYNEQLMEAAKPAWLLNAHEGDTPKYTESHFSGVKPYAPRDEGWPYCEGCKERLSFTCQINFAEFSGSQMFRESGLFQFFYCWNCFPVSREDLALEQVFCCRWYPNFDEATALAQEQVP